AAIGGLRVASTLVTRARIGRARWKRTTLMTAPSSGSSEPRYRKKGSAASDAVNEASETLYVVSSMRPLSQVGRERTPFHRGRDRRTSRRPGNLGSGVGTLGSDPARSPRSLRPLRPGRRRGVARELQATG